MQEQCPFFPWEDDTMMLLTSTRSRVLLYALMAFAMVPVDAAAQANAPTDIPGTSEAGWTHFLSSARDAPLPLGCTGTCTQGDDCEGGCYSCCEATPDDPDCEGVIFCTYCADCQNFSSDALAPDGSIAANLTPEQWRVARLLAETPVEGVEVFRLGCLRAVAARWYSVAAAREVRARARHIEL